MIKSVDKFLSNKKGIASEALPWILISIAILVILMLTIFILKGKGIILIDQLKGIFRF
jgi:hypothetical protein